MAEISARKRIWGWMMFDWATQPFYTLCLTFIFGPYFAEVAAAYYMSSGEEVEVAKAQAQSTWSGAMTMIGLFIAFTAPLLGAIADNSGRRMPWIAFFSVFYIIGTWALWWMVPDGSGILRTLIAFGIAMIAAEYMLVFINAMLPSLCDHDEIGKLSGSGFALGYAGGVIALFMMLLLIAEQSATGKTLALNLDPLFGTLDASEREGTRAVGPFTTLWFVIFMIPFFLWVRDPKRPPKGAGVKNALMQLWRSIQGLPSKTSLFAYLVSSMFYRDALAAIYTFGGVYAALVLGWDITKIGMFGILAAISAGICTWLAGRADYRFGPKPVIVVNAWLLILVVTMIVGMTRDSLFGAAISPEPVVRLPLLGDMALADNIMLLLGMVIGGAGGAMQSASRTLMARHADPERPTEAFGLYAFSGKATAFLAPAMIGIVTTLTESARIGLSPIILLFIVALVLLRWVHPDGQRESTWSAQS